MSTPDPVKVGGFVFHPAPLENSGTPTVVITLRLTRIQFRDPRTGKPQRVTPVEASALLDMVSAMEDDD